MDTLLHDTLATMLTLLLIAYVLGVLVVGLRRKRPGLNIAAATVAAVVIRILASLVVGATSIERELRGGDELAFLNIAGNVAAAPFGSSPWTKELTNELHVFVFALQKWLFDAPVVAMRITQIGIAVAGLVIISAAVYELAGERAARISMWFLALEPTSIFFSSILHKEPLMMLAGALVAYGGALAWTKTSFRAILIITIGCLIGVATRPYAGWFLIAAGAAIIFHAGVRAGVSSTWRRFGFVSLVIVVAAVATPTVLNATSSSSLADLQQSQDQNAADGSNLSLEQVNYSSRAAIITNLPKRVFDVLTRPYIWQVSNISQQLAVFGSLVALTILYLLIREFMIDRKGLFDRAGPLLYVAVGLLIAYSLSAGNAGTAFRYRTHVVVMAGAALIAAYVGRRQAEKEAAAADEDDSEMAAGGPPPLPVAAARS